MISRGRESQRKSPHLLFTSKCQRGLGLGQGKAVSQEFNPGLPQGDRTQTLEHPWLPPGACINRELEQELNPDNLMWDMDVLTGVLNPWSNARPENIFIILSHVYGSLEGYKILGSNFSPSACKKITNNSCTYLWAVM